MATTAKNSTTKRRTNTRTKTTKAQTKPRTTATRSDSAQVKEGVTKASNGAAAIVRQGAERALDVPVGAALTVRDRVEDVVEPWTTASAREKELKSLRTQVTRELNKFERRGGQARRKAVSRVRTTRKQVEREVKARRREVEKQVKQSRTRLETTVKQNRVKAESQLKKAGTAVQDRVGTAS